MRGRCVSSSWCPPHPARKLASSGDGWHERKGGGPAMATQPVTEQAASVPAPALADGVTEANDALMAAVERRPIVQLHEQAPSRGLVQERTRPRRPSGGTRRAGALAAAAVLLLALLAAVAVGRARLSTTAVAPAAVVAA